MRPFQIIFNPTSASELARMPKEFQLQILGEFRGLPQQLLKTQLDDFGKLERAGRTLHRFRVGEYRVYFERHELGLLMSAMVCASRGFRVHYLGPEMPPAEIARYATETGAGQWGEEIMIMPGDLVRASRAILVNLTDRDKPVHLE